MSDELDLPGFQGFNWKKIVTYLIPAIAIAGALAGKAGSKREKAEQEFAQATRAFVKWDQILDKKSDEFASVVKALKKHPELQAQYDASIAQNLLAVNAADEAEPYINRTLNRTHQPYYSEFAKTSLLISKENYEEALSEALALKEEMINDSSFWNGKKEDSALFAFNLMRIATLYEQLNNAKGELAAWEEIKRYSESKEDSHRGFNQLLTHFSVQETTLLDYIKQREEVLNTIVQAE